MNERASTWRIPWPGVRSGLDQGHIMLAASNGFEVWQTGK
jgi:hypothetical protein